MIRFIGDTHGKFKTMAQMMQGANRSIHVGDVGVGFSKYIDGNIKKKYETIPGDHTFIRGNHDKLFNIKHHYKNNWIKDGSYDATIDTFFVGGAWSIDKSFRVEGLNWWKDEEIHQGMFFRILEKYNKIKPSVVVSHDLPSSIPPIIYKFGPYDIMYKNVTSYFLQQMLEMHKPKLWVAGHWHEKRIEVVNGTKFCVVGMNDYLDIDMKGYKIGGVF